MDPRALIREKAEEVAGAENVSSFQHGFNAPFEGLKFLAKNRALWLVAIPPALFNFVITAIVVVILLATGWYWWSQLYPWFIEGQVDAMLWVWGGVAIAVGLLMIFVAIFVGFVVWQISSATLGSALDSRLAKATERHLGLADDDIGDVSLGEDLSDSMLDIVTWLGNIVGGLAVSVVPIIGPIVGGCWMAYANCFQEGAELWQHPLGVRGVRREGRIQFAKQHRAATLGMGVIVMSSQWAPFVSSIMMPSSVIGAVLLYRKVTGESIDAFENELLCGVTGLPNPVGENQSNGS